MFWKVDFGNSLLVNKVIGDDDGDSATSHSECTSDDKFDLKIISSFIHFSVN